MHAGNHGKHGGHPTLLLHGPEEQVSDKFQMDEESRQYTAFTVGSMGVYEFLRMPYGLVQCSSDVPASHCRTAWGS